MRPAGLVVRLARAGSCRGGSSTCGAAVGVQLAKVVDGVAGLVARVGPGQPQLVGLPHQVDQLGQAALRCWPGRSGRPRRRRPGPTRASSSSATARSLTRIERRAASVGCAVKTGRTASRSGGRGDLGRPGCPRSRIRAAARSSQPAARCPPAAQVPGPVHLLGDVGQVEVRGEGAGQLGARWSGQRRPAGGRRTAASVRTRPRTSSTRSKQGLALLAGEGLAEQDAQPADVSPKVGVGHARVLPATVGDGVVRTEQC